MFFNHLQGFDMIPDKSRLWKIQGGVRKNASNSLISSGLELWR